MNSIFENLTNPEFEINGASFRANKLKGLAGFELLEKLRVSLGAQSSGAILGGNEGEVGGSILNALCSVPTENVMAIRAAVMECIDVKLAGTDRFVPANEILGIVDNLIEAVDNYEIIVRGVAVNFTKSIRGLLIRLGLNQSGQDMREGSL